MCFATTMSIAEAGTKGLLVLKPFSFVILLLVHYPAKVKRVQIDNEFLYISNYIVEEKVPLINVEEIKEIVFFEPRVIYVVLSKTTKFGKRIRYFGYYEPFLFFREHPGITLIKKRRKKCLANYYRIN